MSRLGSSRATSRLAAVLVTIVAAVAASPAYAGQGSAEGSLDHVQTRHGTLQVLYSVPGAGTATPDLDSVRLTLDGKRLAATAQLASQATSSVRRTTVLAIDVSNSMAGPKFDAAKSAAQVFLDSAPKDVRVGIVTFAGKVRVLQRPSLDRAVSRRLVDGLRLSLGTHLYDGLTKAVATGVTRGSRSVVVLSDGQDTSTTVMSRATDAIKAAHVKVDVIALAQSARDEKLLTPLSRAGGGSVISASDPEQLGRIFTSEAQALASQILITSRRPSARATEGTLAVSVDVGSRSFTDSAFVTLPATRQAKPKSAAAATVSPGAALQAPSTGLTVSRTGMLAGLAALGAALVVVMAALLGGLGRKQESIESRIAAYTTRGAPPRKSADQPQSMTTQAVNVAQRALAGSQGFEAKLGSKLDGGGLSLKPAEWLLLHAGIALVVTLLAFVLGGGSLLMALVGLGLGLLLPWVYLGFKQSSRLKSFNTQLAPTLQLLAGSLQAGLSIAQGMDTIVREGAEPVAGEFRRALVETRLGVQIEDALDAVAGRMTSEDLEWTVMAIRIQREVGGNLAELLLNVAATLRERDYLRRQVKSLSAEGRFSAYILLAMPPGVLLFEATTNADYLHPLISTPVGFVLLALMIGLMGIGAFMMNRLIKLEV